MAAVAIRLDIESKELRRLAQLERDGRVASRLIAIAAVLDGYSRAAAAAMAGMDRQTLRDWVHRFNAEGPAGLGDRPRSGRPLLLAEELRPDLATLIAAGPNFERDGIVEYRLHHIQELAKRHFGADYSRGGMHAVLHKMGFFWLKPRQNHQNTDLDAQDSSIDRSPPPCEATRRPKGWRYGFRTRLGSSGKDP